jgi:hypothetical protein
MERQGRERMNQRAAKPDVGDPEQMRAGHAPEQIAVNVESLMPPTIAEASPHSMSYPPPQQPAGSWRTAPTDRSLLNADQI